jgi:hypothetical protein
MAEKINLPLDFFSGVNLSGINSNLYSDNPQTTGIDSSTKYNEGLLAGLIADILAAQDPSNYRYGGYVSQGGLDIGEPNRQVINATPEQIAEALSKSKDMATAVLGSTVGSNQMLDDAAMASAQTAAEEALSNISAEGGFSEAEANEVYDLLEAGTVTLNDVSRILNVPQAVVTAGYDQIKKERAAPEEVVDLTEDTTANDLLTGGDGSLGDAAVLGTVNQDSTVDQTTDTTAASDASTGLEDTATTDVSGVKPVTGIEGEIDITGWIRTSELGADTMVYENVNTGETFDIDMTDIENLPENEKTAIETVNQRTDAINNNENAGGVKDTIVINTDGQITNGTETLSKEDSGTFIANLPNTIIEGILDGSLLGQGWRQR